MAYRTGTALGVADLLSQLDDFLTTRNEYQNILVTGTGDGVLTTGVAANAAPTEDWVLTCTVGGPAGTFTVAGSLSGAQADATSGTPYDNGIVAFTITDGATAWVGTDSITFDFVSNMGITKPYRKMMNHTTARTITQSDGLAKFLPHDLHQLEVVPGRFPEEKGLMSYNAVLRSDNADITNGYSITSAAWDAGLNIYSVSVWVRNTSLHTGDNTNNTIYTNHVDGMIYWGPEVVGQAATKGGIYAALSSENLDMGRGRSLALSSRLHMYDIILDRPEWVSGDWRLLTMTCGAADYKTYLDGVLVDTESTQGGTTASFIGGLFGGGSLTPINQGNFVQGIDFHETALTNGTGFSGTISDLCVWNKELDQTEITALYNSSAAVIPGHADILWKLQLQDEIPQQVIYQNDSTRGYSTVMGVGYIEESATFASGVTPSIYFENFPLPSTPQQVDDQEYNSTHRGTQTSVTLMDRFISRDSMRMYGAVRGVNEAIEKYWFTANEDRVMIAYKIHDTGATTQKDPVYQIMYSGLLAQSGHNRRNAVVFGSSGTLIDWQSSSVNFTVGAQDSTAGRCWGEGTTWHRYDADIGGPNEATIRSIGGAHYIWPIQVYNTEILTLQADETGYAGNIVDQSNFGVEYFGTYDGLYKVSPLNVIAEDIITVAGDDYIVLSNVWATSENDWFAFKLT